MEWRWRRRCWPWWCWRASLGFAPTSLAHAARGSTGPVGSLAIGAAAGVGQDNHRAGSFPRPFLGYARVYPSFPVPYVCFSVLLCPRRVRAPQFDGCMGCVVRAAARPPIVFPVTLRPTQGDRRPRGASARVLVRAGARPRGRPPWFLSVFTRAWRGKGCDCVGPTSCQC